MDKIEYRIYLSGYDRRTVDKLRHGASKLGAKLEPHLKSTTDIIICKTVLSPKYEVKIPL
jgi:hypothetical protein